VSDSETAISAFHCFRWIPPEKQGYYPKVENFFGMMPSEVRVWQIQKKM